MSREKIEDESPYSTPFERAIASSREHADHRLGRSEDLLLGDPHPGLHVAEDGRPVVETFLESVAVCDLATGQKRRAFVLADLCVGVDLLERVLVDHRADIGAVFPAGPEP